MVRARVRARPLVLCLLLLAASPAGLVAGAPPGVALLRGESAGFEGLATPWGDAGPVAATDGDALYFFGPPVPRCPNTTRPPMEVVRVDPRTGGTTGAWTLSVPARSESSVVWTGREFLLFGGGWVRADCQWGNDEREIIAFDPATGGSRLLPEPSGGYGAPVWDGERVLAFRWDEPVGVSVVRVDPATGANATVAGPLPVTFAGRSFWDGAAAYLVGAFDPATRRSDLILRYEPGGAFEVLPTRLPAAWRDHAVAWDGSAAYVYGGTSPHGEPWPRVVRRFDPATGAMEDLETPLPYGVLLRSALRVGDAIYLPGGYADVADTGAHGGVTRRVIVHEPATGDLHATGMPKLLTGQTGGRTTAVAFGDRAYLFGNVGPFPDPRGILRYDARTGGVSDVEAKLPTWSRQPGVVAAGDAIYLIGGAGGDETAILRFDPATETVHATAARLPQALQMATLVWDGSVVWILGGLSPSGPVDTILRFDPARGAVEPWGATLPHRGYAMAGAHVDGAIVLAGGLAWNGQWVEPWHGAMRIHLAERAYEAFPDALPASPVLAGGVSDGQTLTLLGGHDGGAHTTIVRLYLETMHGEVAAARLPQGRSGAAVFPMGGDVLVAAGEGHPFDPRLLRYHPGPRPPDEVRAFPGDGAGEVVVSWTPRADADGQRATTFDVHRGSGPSDVAFVARVEGATTFTDRVAALGPLTYRVAAVREGESGILSAPASATPGPSAAPGAPRALAASAGPGLGTATLTWSPPAGDGAVTGYRVHRASGGEVETTDVPSPGWTDRFLPQGAHEYWVTALRGAVEGPASRHANVTVRAPPVVAFGDSVAAGHGLGGLAHGYPHNGPLAYPAQVAARLGASVANFAISGACTVATDACRDSVLAELETYRSVRGGSPELESPLLATLTVGANDIGFAGCLEAALTGRGSGDCEPAPLARNLTRYETNLRRVVADMRATLPDATPIVVTRYFNPFPSAEEEGCLAFGVLAAGRGGIQDERTRDASLREAQGHMHAEAARITAALNAVIDRVAADEGLRVADLGSFDGHDMCRASRDAEDAAAPGNPATWTYAWRYVLWLNSTLPGGARTEIVFPPAPDAAPACLDETPDPPPVDTGEANPAAYGIRWPHLTYRVVAGVNCMPHPTPAGAEAIAESVMRAFRGRGDVPSPLPLA